jgi:hypothetical protein
VKIHPSIISRGAEPPSKGKDSSLFIYLLSIIIYFIIYYNLLIHLFTFTFESFNTQVCTKAHPRETPVPRRPRHTRAMQVWEAITIIRATPTTTTITTTTITMATFLLVTAIAARKVLRWRHRSFSLITSSYVVPFLFVCGYFFLDWGLF